MKVKKKTKCNCREMAIRWSYASGAVWNCPEHGQMKLDKQSVDYGTSLDE